MDFFLIFQSSVIPLEVTRTYTFYLKVYLLKFIENQNCTVAGWGLAKDGYPHILRDVFVPIRNTKQCEKDYRNLTKKKKGGTFDPKSF